MPTKTTFIVVDNEAHLDDFDAHSLNFNHERDVDKIAGVILRDTRKALGYLPVFYYDREGYITGFEGWGGDEIEVTVVPSGLDLSTTLVDVEPPKSKLPYYRYSARASQEGGQGGLEVKIYTKQSNLQPVIVIKAIVTQLLKKDVSPILDLKFAVYQDFKDGRLSQPNDPYYSVMEEEAVSLGKAIDQKFQDGDHNPTSLIMLVHHFLVSGIAGAA
jgi:hypothetical protein